MLAVLLAAGIGVAYVYTRTEGEKIRTSPPIAIGDFAIYRNRGMVEYWFSLVDLDGKATSSDGDLEILIFERDFLAGTRRQVCRHTWNVRAADFHRTKIGKGAFQREEVVFSLEIIPETCPDLFGEQAGRNAELRFTTKGGAVLFDEDSFI